MIFANNFARNYEKKILGTSDAWSLSLHPSDPAYYIEDCRIFILFFVKDQLRCHHNYDGMISSQINGSDKNRRRYI